MSIINDALKKVQTDLTQQNEQTPPQLLEHKQNTEPQPKSIETPPQNTPSAEQPKDKKSPSKNNSHFPFVLLILLTAILVTLLASKNSVKTIKKEFASIMKSLKAINIEQRISPTPKTTPLVTTSPTEQPKEKPLNFKPITIGTTSSIKLQGIVTMDNKTVALINEKIYEVGNIIDGKQIVSISIDQVELQEGDKTIILKVRN